MTAARAGTPGDIRSAATFPSQAVSNAPERPAVQSTSVGLASGALGGMGSPNGIGSPAGSSTGVGAAIGTPAVWRGPDDFGERANELITGHVPRVAQRAERLVMRVLHAAAEAEWAGHEGEIRQAARAMRVVGPDAMPALSVSGDEAQRLKEAASAAFWSEHSARRAAMLQTRAFGANPLDPDVAGDLAFYLLKQHPVPVETARQLALYALAMSDPIVPTGRVQDWTTLAIASALAGRTRDATNAWIVTLALADSIDRPCRSALAAYASHGERLRASTEAMLDRVRAWGRSGESSFCRWPPSWAVGMR